MRKSDSSDADMAVIECLGVQNVSKAIGDCLRKGLRLKQMCFAGLERIHSPDNPSHIVTPNGSSGPPSHMDIAKYLLYFERDHDLPIEPTRDDRPHGIRRMK